MANDQEGRIRRLEFQQLIDRTERYSQQRIEERNRRRRTELIAWIALVISIASIIINAIDKLA